MVPKRLEAVQNPMASLTLKNLSDEFLQSLRDAAERDRRSLTQEMVYLLEAALGRRETPTPRRPARLDAEAQVAAWRKLAGKWESDLDSAAESERIIEARTPGREVDL
jgi:plasmid stability protein